MGTLDTAIGGQNARFPPTDWTQLENPLRTPVALAELCRKYWKPLYAYLQCRGCDNEQAKDLVQGFFADKMFNDDFLSKSDRTKGRFRNFILVAIRNYAANSLQKQTRLASLNTRALPHNSLGDPETEFNRAWARQLLNSVLQELELECRQRGKQTHWNVFSRWLLESGTIARHGQMAELCTMYGIPDAPTAYNMIANLKKRFRAILRRHLRSQVRSEEDVDVEIQDFLKLFSRSPAR